MVHGVLWAIEFIEMWRNVTATLKKFKFASLKDKFASADKRKQQQVIDTHRLYLYLSLYQHESRRSGARAEGWGDQLLAQAKELGASGQATAVQAMLREQLMGIARACHDCLLEAGDPMHAAQRFRWPTIADDADAGIAASGSGSHAAPKRQGPDDSMNVPAADQPSATGRGLILAVGSKQHSGSSANASSAASATGSYAASTGVASISQAELSRRLRQRLGFTLSVRRSQIAHEEAGGCQWHVTNALVIALKAWRDTYEHTCTYVDLPRRS